MTKRPSHGAPRPATSTTEVVTSVPRPTDHNALPRCDFAGILCGTLGWDQREAAGRARLCCRSYLYGYGEDGE